MCIRKRGLEMSRSRVKISKACNWRLSQQKQEGMRSVMGKYGETGRGQDLSSSRGRMRRRKSQLKNTLGMNRMTGKDPTILKAEEKLREAIQRALLGKY